MEAVDYTPHHRISEQFEWVNLNLPSGNLWSSEDGEPPKPIPEGYVESAPSKKDIEELRAFCQQQAEGTKLCIIGPNSRVIAFQERQYKMSGGGRDKYGLFEYRLSIYSSPTGFLHINEDDPYASGTYRAVLHKG